MLGEPPQKLLNWAYMPNVEKFNVTVVFDNLNYLEQSLPFVKSMEVDLFSQHLSNGKSNLLIILENINKLKHLESLTFNMNGWDGSAFKNSEDLQKIQSLHQLKKFKIHFKDIYDYERIEKENFMDMLKKLLPNTDVQIAIQNRYITTNPGDVYNDDGNFR